MTISENNSASNTKFKSIATKLSFRITVMIVVSALLVGSFGLVLFRANVISISAEKALVIAESLAAGIDGDSLEQAMQTGVKDAQWDSIKKRADTVMENTVTRYLYIMGNEITNDEINYYIEGVGPQSIASETKTFMEPEAADVFGEELYETLKTGISSTTDVVDSGQFGLLISGNSAVRNSKGEVVAVVGADVAMEEAMADVYTFALESALIILVCVVIFSIFTVAYVRKRIKNPIMTVTDAAKKLAVGDTDVELHFVYNDEIGVLVRAFEAIIKSTDEQIEAFKKISEGDLSINVVPRSAKDNLSYAIDNTMKKIQMMVDVFRQNADNLNKSSMVIANDSNTFAKDGLEESKAIEGIVSSVAQITENTVENSEKAKQVTQLIIEMEEKAHIGFDQMQEMIEAVNEIQRSFDAITAIVGNIESIAFQTNILSLNAAVEAARASHFGKGFAVVAEEVGNLATKSFESAKNTGALIEESRQTVLRGVEVTKEAAVAFDELAEKIRQGGELLTYIVAASANQGEEIVKINEDIERVNKMMKRSAQAAEGSAKIGEDLRGKAEQLTTIINYYKVHSDN